MAIEIEKVFSARCVGCGEQVVASDYGLTDFQLSDYGEVWMLSQFGIALTHEGWGNVFEDETYCPKCWSDEPCCPICGTKLDDIDKEVD